MVPGGAVVHVTRPRRTRAEDEVMRYLLLRGGRPSAGGMVAKVRKGKQSHSARIRAEKQSLNVASSLQTLDLTSSGDRFRAPSLR
jgi:hypothetical protein